MACFVKYHGDFQLKDISAIVDNLQSRVNINFVYGFPNRIKLGKCCIPSVVFPEGDLARQSRPVYVLSNSTAMIETWSRLRQKFDLLYSKRSLTHWFLNDGMNIEEFKEARDGLVLLEAEYKEMTTYDPDFDDEDP
jgi:tubulin alpha